jgi:hypothetical protein
MLRLAHPAPRGQGTDPPARRRGIPSPAFSLTTDEARHLRASIRNVARVHYGTLRKLAAALGVNAPVLTRRRHPSAGLAVAVWRLTGIPVEALLSPKLAAVQLEPAPAKDGAS